MKQLDGLDPGTAEVALSCLRAEELELLEDLGVVSLHELEVELTPAGRRLIARRPVSEFEL